MRNSKVSTNDFTAQIFLKLSLMITQTGDFTLTWEELLNELTDGNEDTILRGLQRYVSELDLSGTKFESLTNPNLFSLENMVFVDSVLESYCICYNDREILFISRDLTISKRAVLVDPENPRPYTGTVYTSVFKNTL